MKPTLLIVDDIKAVREKLRDALEDEFDIVGIAGSGAEAIRQCADFTPQLVLMDLVMPKMSGIEATKAILAQANPAPKVVVLSALHDENIVLRALEAGASEYLIKPVSPDDLRHTLRASLEEHATRVRDGVSTRCAPLS